MARATVTPQMAAKWLAKSSVKNRPISEAVIKRYAEAMKSGKWVYTGEPIILDKEQNIVDGQHRLRACVFSGHGFETEVIVGVEHDKAFNYIDIGKNRTAGDRMAIRGEEYHMLLGAAVTWIAKLQDPRIMIHGKYKVTPDAEEATLKKFPEIRDAVAQIQSSNFFRKTIRNVALLAALKTLFKRVNEDSAELFFEELESGAGLTRESPVRGLRDRLISEASNRATTMKKVYLAALIVKAFNYYHYGVPLSETRLAPAEEFPNVGDDPRKRPSVRRRMRRRGVQASA